MLNKAKATLQMLMSREVSLHGRILLIKSKLFSLIQYAALLHNLPPPVLKKLEDMAWSFLWKKKLGSALAKKKAYKSIAAGGLNYPNLQRSIKARRATLVATLLDPNSTAFWVQVYKAEGGHILGNDEFRLDLLLTTTPIRRFKKTLDPFWMTTFQAWKDLQGDRLEVTDMWEPEEVAQLPIFGTPQISVQPQATIYQKTAERNRVRQLHHILWPQQAQGTAWTRRIATRKRLVLDNGHILLEPVANDKVQGIAGPPAVLSDILLSRI